MKKIILVITSLFLLLGCSTNRSKRFTAIGSGFTLGAVIGASTAPKNEREELHALYWGGIVGLLAAIVGDFYFSDERDLEVQKLENEKLRAQLDFFQNNSATLLKERLGPADKKVFPGGKAQIKLYKVDQWVEDGPYRRYHRDLLMELAPLEKGP